MKKGNSLTAGLLVGVMLINTAYAEFDHLKQGDSAPYTGFLISPSKEQELRLINERLKLDEALIKQYDIVQELNKKHVEVLQQRLDIYQNENIRLSKEIIESRGDGFWNKFLYFALGVLATTAIVYGVNQAVR